MKGKLIAWLLAAAMIVGCFTAAFAEEMFGPIYDEWSEKTDDELYEEAKAEGGELTVYATSSKMLKAEEKFEEAIGHAGTIFPDCVCDKGRLTVETDAGKVVSGREGAQLLRTEVIDGIEYLLVPMSGEVTVNGIRVLKKA